MLLRPTRVHAKPARFHISAPGYAKNAPDFTLPNRDTPKTCPILGANPCRGTFRGVCNTPLHGYVQNLAGFIFPHTNTSKTHPISSSPIRMRPKRTRFHPSQLRTRPKPARFYTQTVVEGHFGGVCNTPLHGYVKSPPDFIFSHTYPPKTHPISPFPIRIRPKPARF